jgi:hypothetical protein
MATKPTPNEALVEVFGSKEESEVMVVSGLLETAGIDNLVSSTDAPQDVLPGVGGVVVKVRESRLEEARRVIEIYRTSAEDDLSEEEAEEIPPEEPA